LVIVAFCIQIVPEEIRFLLLVCLAPRLPKV